MIVSKRIADYPEYYASSNGEIYSFYSKRIKKLKQKRNKIGYMSVSLYKDKKKTSKLVHRLVAQCFLENTHNLPQINHIDGNKSNNKAENLQWCSAVENIKHSYDVLHRKPSMAGRTGFLNPLSKPVKQIKDGVVIKTYGNPYEAERQTKIPASHIRDCCLGKRKTSKGYAWQYDF